jgi:mono/diheme cytochrome c family protein
MNNKSETKTGVMERLKEKLPALLVLAVVVGGVLIFVYQSNSRMGSALLEVKIPALSVLAQRGERMFAENCAQCHGVNAAGGPGGPPLIHAIYNPGHHGDGAFWLAMQRGVAQHHWRFGNMPPQPQIGLEDAKAIVRYVREVQTANGIRTKPHRMN